MEKETKEFNTINNRCIDAVAPLYAEVVTILTKLSDAEKRLIKAQMERCYLQGMEDEIDSQLNSINNKLQTK